MCIHALANIHEGEDHDSPCWSSSRNTHDAVRNRGACRRHHRLESEYAGGTEGRQHRGESLVTRHGDGAHRDVRRRQFRPAAVHALCSGCSRHASWRRAPCGRPIRSSFCIGDAPMAEQQTATCRECSRTISPGDTLVFGYGRLGHLVCRLLLEKKKKEPTLAFLYVREHESAEYPPC